MTDRQTVETRISRSAELFRDCVWPALRPMLGNPDLIQVEAVTEYIAAARLDQSAGIDSWVVHGDSYVRGLASRVQTAGGRNWRTCTVRVASPTGLDVEYHKRLKAIMTDGALYPHYWAQGYVSPLAFPEPQLLGAAICRTTDLIAAVAAGVGYDKPNSEDGKIFRVISWQQLRDRGCKVIEVGLNGEVVNTGEAA